MNGSSKMNSFNVGFVLFVATVIVIIALFWVGSGGGLFQRQAAYYFLCESTSRLKEGSRVYLSGVPVGKVNDIDFVKDLTKNSVKVTIAINERVMPRIRADSSVSLQSDGLLGDVSVHISMGTDKKKALPPGEEIPYQSTSTLEDFVGAEFSGTATNVLHELVVVLKQIKEGEGTIGKLLREPELYDNLNAFLQTLVRLTAKLDEVAVDLRTFSRAVGEQKGVLGKLIFSEDYDRDFTTAVASTAEILTALEGALENSPDQGSVLNRLLLDEKLGERMENVLTRLEEGSRSLAIVLGKVERGEGSVGQLIHDSTIVASIKDLFLGVQELGYMRNLIQNAELQGREANTAEERASLMARLEASRARMLARLAASGTKEPDEEKKENEEDPSAPDKKAPEVQAPEGKKDGAPSQ